MGGAVAVDDGVQEPRLELVRALALEMVRWMSLIMKCSEEVAGRCLWIVIGAEMRHVGRLGRQSNVFWKQPEMLLLLLQHP